MSLLLDTIELDAMRSIESLTIVAPLGVRFWDDVSGAPVTSGLRVVAYPDDAPARRQPALPNRSGTYVFQSLPGLRAALNGAGDAAYWATPPAARTFVVEVVDDEGRFLPTTFTVRAPFRGVFPGDHTASPPPGRPGVPLYSSPSRPVPAATAVVRATLEECAGGGRPAAWAVLTARLPDRSVVRGVADVHGRVVLIFPYPEPVLDAVHAPDSPPATTGASLRDQQWPIELEAAYDALQPEPALPRGPAIPSAEAVAAQRSRRLWADAECTQPLTRATLRFGTELLLRSVDQTKVPPELPQLFIEAPASPP